MDGITPSPGVSMAVAEVLKAMGPDGLFSRPVPDGAVLARPLDLLDPSSWTDPPPPRRWIVQDWIPRGAVTALYGDGGIGKSLLAQQLLTCIALGAPWLGLDTAGGRALGVFCEDEDDELRRRQSNINEALGVKPDALANLRLLSRLGEDNVLMDFSASDRGVITDFCNSLDATLSDFRPALLVLDTAADMFGGNENIRPQVRRFLGACLGKMARNRDCAVLLLAHPSQSGLANGSGSGGSTAWSNTVRSRLYFTRPDGDDEGAASDRRVLTRKKANYAPADARIEVAWQRGAFVVPVVGEVDSATWPAISAMFDELERAWVERRAWSYRAETRKGGRYFPAWAQRQLGVPEKRTANLLSEWLMNGCLQFEVFNSDAKTRGLKVVRRPDR